MSPAGVLSVALMPASEYSTPAAEISPPVRLNFQAIRLLERTSL